MALVGKVTQDVIALGACVKVLICLMVVSASAGCLCGYKVSSWCQRRRTAPVVDQSTQTSVEDEDEVGKMTIQAIRAEIKTHLGDCSGTKQVLIKRLITLRNRSSAIGRT